MAIVVTFDGTRLNDAQDQTPWTDWGATATDETDFFYNGSQCISCLVKTSEVGQAYEHGSTTDFSSPAKVWLAKIIQTNYGAIDDATNGLQLYIGTSTTQHYRYEIFKSTTYPPIGGWQMVPIDPNVAGYINQNVGSMTGTTAIDFFGMKSECSATAKAPNLGSAAIDYVESGKGLTLVGTDTTPASFQDFVDADEGSGLTQDRVGIVHTKSGVIYVVGVLTIGSSSETDFDDANQELVFPDGRFNTGFCGVDIVLGNASSTITIDSCVFRGRGEYGHDGGTADTRPDFEISGTSGSATVDGCSFLNHRNVTFTSASSMNGGRIECRLLTQNSANLSNLTIVTDSLTSVACLQDPTFGTTTDLHDIDFVQGGAGHAIELDTATSYTLTNITFTGYGSDTTDSAALDVTASSGTVTINVVGGSTPTYKSAGATVSIVVNPVTLGVTVYDGGVSPPTLLQGARVLVYCSDYVTGAGFPYMDSVSITGSGTTATVTHTGHGLASNDNVVIRGANEDVYNGAYQITYVSADSYTYTTNETIGTSPATGTITSTFAFINTTTDSNGYASDSRVVPDDQPVVGWVRKSTSSPYFKQGDVVGVVDNSSGLSISIQLTRDE